MPKIEVELADAEALVYAASAVKQIESSSGSWSAETLPFRAGRKRVLSLRSNVVGDD